MDDDTSKAAKVCEDWGVENGRRNKVGKWSAYGRARGESEDRSYQYIIIVWAKYHWLIDPGVRVECDDFMTGVSSGDFWKIYVR